MTEHRCAGCWVSSFEKKLVKHGEGPLAFWACADCEDIVDQYETRSPGTPFMADLREDADA